jgi:hypothetical protein
MSGHPPLADGVQVRFLVARGLPLLVASIPDEGRGPELHTALVEHGLVELPAFLGVDLPRGVRVGFVVDPEELRLVDERDATLLRAPRAGVDPAWLGAAKRLKGTMTVVLRGVELDPDEEPRDLAARIDAEARRRRTLGAIVGLVEERPQLPLLF